jgi:hypothetical protein
MFMSIFSSNYSEVIGLMGDGRRLGTDGENWRIGDWDIGNWGMLGGEDWRKGDWILGM